MPSKDHPLQLRILACDLCSVHKISCFWAQTNATWSTSAAQIRSWCWLSTRANHRAALVSFPRDVYLPIPGVGYNRINVAYPFGEEAKKGGGLPLLMSTIDKNFGIPIDSYVRIDFSGFQDVIDALGGVDVVVDCALYDELIYRYFNTYTLEPGTYHMNGQQALYYARSRKTTSDFDRARRQQRVLLAIRKRVLDGGLVPRVPALWMALRDTVDTNMNPADIAELAKFGAGLDGKDLSGSRDSLPVGHRLGDAAGGDGAIARLTRHQQRLGQHLEPRANAANQRRGETLPVVDRIPTSRSGLRFAYKTVISAALHIHISFM